MDLGANKTPVKVIKEGALGGTYFRILETFILVLMRSDTKNHGKNLISWKILIKSIIAHINTMLVLINMVLNAEHR